MIFQDPTACLNPVFTVGDQMIETLRKRGGLGKSEARERAVELLDRVGVPSPERRLAAYPHQLSGGMRQRVMIAIAISARPKLLLADEPTTALDVTTQEQILALLIEHPGGERDGDRARLPRPRRDLRDLRRGHRDVRRGGCWRPGSTGR